MSLSRFYKANNNFKPKAVLDTTDPGSREPVWGSIVKDKIINPKSVLEDVQEPVIPASETPEDAPEISQPTESLEEDALDNGNEDVTAGSSASPEAPVPPEPAPPAAQPEPVIDIEAIRENAFTSGIAAGRQQAEEDFENIAQTLLSICNELDRLRETILQNSAGEMKELVLAISERIIRHSVQEQGETIIAIIKDAIHLAVKSDEFQIMINPEDLEIVKSQKDDIINSISGLDSIVLKPDPNIERGGCKLESICCTVDADMASQIKVIHDAILASDTLPEQKDSGSLL